MNFTDELINWSFETKCKKAVQSLAENGFTAVYCPKKGDAFNYIIKEANEAETIGTGNSLSLADINILEKLEAMGKKLFTTIHGKPDITADERLTMMRKQLTCDLFLTGTNALVMSGSLVNIDATGNRVASMIFGPKKVIVVAGRNKLVNGLDEAVNRIKTYAAPPNAKRLNYNTPCAKTGFCTNCNSPQRICNIITIIERKPRLTDVRVLVVNEDMGL